MSNQNRAEATLEKQLINRIVDLERNLRALTTPQPIGGDVLEAVLVPDETDSPLLVGPIALGAGSYLNAQIPFNPALNKVLQANVLLAFYIDAYDAGHHFPDGGSLNAGQKNVRFTSWDDLDLYDSVTGAHTYGMILENFDTVTHNFYIAARFIAPKGALA